MSAFSKVLDPPGLWPEHTSPLAREHQAHRGTMNTIRAERHVELQAFESRRHAELLKSWLKHPHVNRWWGDQEQELPVLLRRPTGTHAVIVVDEIPVGYLCWGSPAAEELMAAGLTDLPDALVDIDILIGELQYVGCGIGPRALCLLLGQLRHRTEVRWAGVGTSRSNQTALSAFEKAGFRPFRDFVDPEYGPSRYLLVDLREAAYP